jgi:DNA-binding protein H-NS
MEFPSFPFIAMHAMNSLQDLIAQKEALEKRIAHARQSDRTEKIVRIKHLMHELGLRPSDLNGSAKRTHRQARGKVAAKYRDPVSGALWSGRGLAPKWIAGRDRTPFLIRP